MQRYYEYTSLRQPDLCSETQALDIAFVQILQLPLESASHQYSSECRYSLFIGRADTFFHTELQCCTKNGLKSTCKILKRIWPRCSPYLSLFFPLLCLKVVGSRTVQGLSHGGRNINSGLSRAQWFHCSNLNRKAMTVSRRLKGIEEALDKFWLLDPLSVTNAVSWFCAVWKLSSAPRY